MDKAVNMKLKITFIVFLVLILTNIGILFISKNEIFTKTLIGLIATAFILYYALAWIKTIKSIKKDSSKSGVKNLFIGILKLPYELVKVVLKIIKKTFSFFFGLIDVWVDDTINDSLRDDYPCGNGIGRVPRVNSCFKFSNSFH
ncbi:hypothetical protein OLP57_04845 [Campylobacter jejuni]|uniref:hypothetical protein n=1 Tax=Campylobacter TaxID=194 RepID=UPI000F7FE83A|nr:MULTISPECIES: hypothetical protein [Campylobacter]EAK4034065.1 hypothetical protein [Campylobacter jejuni]MCW1342180.1 hypothetical protein [Campylobacter jejuni]RTJ50469.1 hypothetical protein C3H71_08905 [Campylobacter jejuni]RTJ71761.1 hypothetical protein C3H53_09075 [Campylobacter jejuni]RTJ81154.1 hypothetical protein C3H50_09055 [Campylobacter jejuni]